MSIEEQRRLYREAKERQRARMQWLVPVLACHDDVATVLAKSGLTGDDITVVMRDGSAFDVAVYDQAGVAFGLDVGGAA